MAIKVELKDVSKATIIGHQFLSWRTVAALFESAGLVSGSNGEEIVEFLADNEGLRFLIGQKTEK